MSYATEEGYAYLYISNENATAVDVYFDDVTMTYTPTRVIQYNEYYPFGLQTSNSWTRENSSNNFLYNEGSELNSTTGFYDLPFRNYDATLGRFFQVDPLAHVDQSTSPFAYAGNNPVMINDPSGLLVANPGNTATERTIYRKYASNGSSLDFWNWATDNGYGATLSGESLITSLGGGGGGATFGERNAERTAKEILKIAITAGDIWYYTTVDYSSEIEGGGGMSGSENVWIKAFGSSQTQNASPSGWQHQTGSGFSWDKFHWHVGGEANATLGWFNADIEIKNFGGFVWREDAKVLGTISADNLYDPENTSFSEKQKYITEYGLWFEGGFSYQKVIEEKNGIVVDRSKQLNLGYLCFGIQFNWDDMGLKDIRAGFDSGIGWSTGIGGKIGLQLGGIYKNR